MAAIDKTALFAAIDADITTNGNGEISGAELNALLKSIGDSYPNLIDDAGILGLGEYDPARVYDTGIGTIESGEIWQANSDGLTGVFVPGSWTQLTNIGGSGNLYSADGTLAGARKITTGGFALTLEGDGANFVINNTLGTSAAALTINSAAGTNGGTGVIFSSAGAEMWRHGNNHAGGGTANEYVIATGSFDTLHKLVINRTTGFVGLGDNTPTERLTVNGAILIGAATNTANGTIRWTGADFEGRKAGVWTSFTSAGGGNTIYSASDSLAGNITVTQAANLLAFTATAVNAFSIDGTTLSVDATNGRVGFGTAAPGATIHVIGTSIFTGDMAVDTDTFFVDVSTDRIGMGLTNPAFPLQLVASGISGANTNFLADIVSAASGGTRAGLVLGYDKAGAIVGVIAAASSANNGGIAIETGSNLRSILWDENGNMGHGTIAFGTNSGFVYSQGLGTAPSTSPADVSQQYVLDHDGAGTATTHWRNEEGHIFKLVQSSAYTRTATVVEDRTLLASASATALNNNNVLASLIVDLQATGIIA